LGCFHVRLVAVAFGEQPVEFGFLCVLSRLDFGLGIAEPLTQAGRFGAKLLGFVEGDGFVIVDPPGTCCSVVSAWD
jgi:hypothetical protein